MERIEYFLPPLGPVVAELHQESKDLYLALSRTKELDRLKSISQLGIVPQAFESARHTRWEYISLALHIIRVCKTDTRLGLNSKVSLPSGYTVSSAQELLQCWMLLLHIGHLQWTFTSEKLLFEQLQLDGDVGQQHLEQLLESVPAGPPRIWAISILEKTLYYQYYQILAFYRLQRISTTEEMRSLWQNILFAYVSQDDNESKALSNARTHFKSIRRLSFLYLDAEYSPTALSLRLPHILNSPSEMERLLDQRSLGYNDELNGLENFLTRNVYLAPDVLEETAQIYFPLRDQIRDGLKNQPLQQVVEHLAAPKFALKGTAKEEQLTRIVRLELDPRVTPFLPSDELKPSGYISTSS